VLGFGFPLLICVAGLTVKPGHWMKHYWQVVLWFFLSLAFAYLPVWFQRKLIFGAQIPLCILAGISLDLILTRVSWLRSRNWTLVSGAIILVPFLIATPVFLFLKESSEVRSDAGGAYFISNDVLKGLNFLKHRSKPREVVFASLETSRLIPAFSGNTVIWGHWAMSVDQKEREHWIALLLDKDSNWQDSQRSSDFWGTGIQYIFADGNLRKSIEHNPYLWWVILSDADRVFANTSVTIYKHRTGKP
jgi:hypothetical protein